MDNLHGRLLGIFPDLCKLAKLKSTLNKGSRMDPSNYRPVSLLTLISKIFEKIVHDRMIDYLAQHDIFTNVNPVLEQNIQLTCVFRT